MERFSAPADDHLYESCPGHAWIRSLGVPHFSSNSSSQAPVPSCSATRCTRRTGCVPFHIIDICAMHSRTGRVAIRRTVVCAMFTLVIKLFIRPQFTVVCSSDLFTPPANGLLHTPRSRIANLIMKADFPPGVDQTANSCVPAHRQISGNLVM